MLVATNFPCALPPPILTRPHGFSPAPSPGQVTKTLSPFEQRHVAPFLNPGRLFGVMKHKVTDNFWDVVPTFCLFYGVIKWSEHAHHEDMKSQWD